MDELTLEQKVVLISREFSRHEIPHAFGGAIALAFYAEPRATIDIDVNVFVTTDRAEPILDRLAELGASFSREETMATISLCEQVRIKWGGTLVDLFFIADAFHESCARRVRTVPFLDETIVILAPEDLAVFKTMYGRRRDWLDIEQMLFATAGSFDLGYLRRWILRIMGEDDHRVKGLEATIDRILGPDA